MIDPTQIWFFSEELQKHAGVSGPPAEAPSSGGIGKKLLGGAAAVGVGALALKNPKFAKKYFGDVVKAVKNPVKGVREGFRSTGANTSSVKRMGLYQKSIDQALKGQQVSYKALGQGAGARGSGWLGVGTTRGGAIQGTKAQKKAWKALSESAQKGTASEAALAKAYQQIHGMSAKGPTGFQKARNVLSKAAPGEKAVLTGFTGYGANEGMKKKDPVTGRERGIAERVGRTAAAVGSAALWPLYMPTAGGYGAGASKIVPSIGFSVAGTGAAQKAMDVAGGGGGKLVDTAFGQKS